MRAQDPPAHLHWGPTGAPPIRINLDAAGRSCEALRESRRRPSPGVRLSRPLPQLGWEARPSLRGEAGIQAHP
eukprot:2164790-Pyramimonas_sp.AAC.1